MNYEIIDRVVYKTTQYLVSGNDGIEYQVKYHEDDFMDYWSIWSDENGDIDPHSELGSELIRLCMNHDYES